MCAIALLCRLGSFCWASHILLALASAIFATRFAELDEKIYGHAFGSWFLICHFYISTDLLCGLSIDFLRVQSMCSNVQTICFCCCARNASTVCSSRTTPFPAYEQRKRKSDRKPELAAWCMREPPPLYIYIYFTRTFELVVSKTEFALHRWVRYANWIHVLHYVIVLYFLSRIQSSASCKHKHIWF